MDLLPQIQQRTKNVTLGKDDTQPLAGPCPLVHVHVLDGSGGILTVGEGVAGDSAADGLVNSRQSWVVGAQVTSDILKVKLCCWYPRSGV